MTSRFVYRALPLLVCLIVCTVINLYYFGPPPNFPDEPRFIASAVHLAATGEYWVNGGRAWEMPGTALFFAPAMRLFGAAGAVVPIRMMQSILLIAQAVLAGSIARRLFGKGAAEIIAVTIVALYPFFLFYQGLLLSETLFTTLLVAAFAALYWWRDRGRRIDVALLVTCLCFAAATYVKPTLTFLPPVLIAATAWANGARLKKAVAVLLAASCLYAAFMSPWWIRNAVVLGAFVPFTTSSAKNLYLGNNPHNPDGGADWTKDADPAVVDKLNRMPDELARQGAYKALATDYIKNNPGAALRVAAKKFVRLWNVVPNGEDHKTAFYVIVSAASFAPVLLLALACALRWWRRWRMFVPIYLLIAYFTFAHVAVVAGLRYRLPIEPFLIVMAAGLLGEACDRLRGQNERTSPAA